MLINEFKLLILLSDIDFLNLTDMDNGDKIIKGGFGWYNCRNAKLRISFRKAWKFKSLWEQIPISLKDICCIVTRLLNEYINWWISACANITHWILAFGIHEELSPSNELFGKSNRSNLFLPRSRVLNNLSKDASKFVDQQFPIEIIKEQLSKFSGTRRSMVSKSHKDFRHSLVKGLYNLIVRFWLGSWITVAKISTTILALEDLFWITSKQNFEFFRRISIRISSIDGNDFVYQSSHDVTAFALVPLLQFFPFASSSGYVDKWVVWKTKRARKCILLFLHVAKWDCWHHVMIDDESWLFWLAHHAACRHSQEMIWPQSREPIFNIKFMFMFTITWNPCGFYIVDKLLNDIKKNNK
jgi:hypothetical protein